MIRLDGSSGDYKNFGRALTPLISMRFIAINTKRTHGVSSGFLAAVQRPIRFVDQLFHFLAVSRERRRPDTDGDLDRCVIRLDRFFLGGPADTLGRIISPLAVGVGQDDAELFPPVTAGDVNLADIFLNQK